MAVVKASDIIGVRYGALQAKALYLGDTLLWPSNKFLRVEPQFIFLTPWNQFTDDTDVFSNVEWHTL